MAETYHMTLKIILLGDYSVNKGTLLRALMNMPQRPEVKCLGFRSGVVEMLFVREGKRIRVRVYDTAGQERFRSITSSYYRGAHGCILMFDVTQRATFEGLDEWHRELHTNSLTDDIAVTLAGCHSHVTGSGEQQVGKRTAQDFADYLGIPYQELSVQNVATVLHTLEELVDRIVVKVSRSTSALCGGHSVKPSSQKLTDSQQEEEGEGVSVRRKCAC